MRHAALFASCALALVAAPGCAPTVGPREACDEAAAREVVYLLGEPMYAGQAILVESCGGGACCHTDPASFPEDDPRLPRFDRGFGVPYGLFFDVHPLSVTASDVEGDERRLRDAQAAIVHYRDRIWARVLDGTMPPPLPTGASLRCDRPPTEPYRHGYALGPGPDGFPAFEPIAPLLEGETRETLRNWLACGAPVVERSRVPIHPLRCAADADCANTGVCELDATSGSGECAWVGDFVPATEFYLRPEWPEIYDTVLSPSCAATVGCHAAAFPSADLDLSSAAGAYLALLGPDGRGAAAGATGVGFAACGDVPDLRRVDLTYYDGNRGTAVRPSDSLLVGKLRGTASCGNAMPLGAPLPDAVIESIEEWIVNGAPESGPGAPECVPCPGAVDPSWPCDSCPP